jgi:hypothetical protein
MATMIAKTPLMIDNAKVLNARSFTYQRLPRTRLTSLRIKTCPLGPNCPAVSLCYTVEESRILSKLFIQLGANATI